MKRKLSDVVGDQGPTFPRDAEHTAGAIVSQDGPPPGTVWTDFGTFEFGGVQCEECHGQGSQHASDPQRFGMMVDNTSNLCGRCHTRDPQNRVLVSGGYIRHHEQYDEMVHSPHAAVGCGSCHDPHASNMAGMLRTSRMRPSSSARYNVVGWVSVLYVKKKRLVS